jgi:hypothetical protein
MTSVPSAGGKTAAVIDVTEEFGLGELTVRKGVGVFIKRFWWFPRLELGGEVVVKGQQRVVPQEPGCRAVEAPLRRWSGGRLVRPEVRLPQVVGTVHQRHLHQPQRSVEVAGNALDKRVLHAFGIAQVDGTGANQGSGLLYARVPTRARGSLARLWCLADRYDASRPKEPSAGYGRRCGSPE